MPLFEDAATVDLVDVKYLSTVTKCDFTNPSTFDGKVCGEGIILLYDADNAAAAPPESSPSNNGTRDTTPPSPLFNPPAIPLFTLLTPPNKNRCPNTLSLPNISLRFLSQSYDILSCILCCVCFIVISRACLMDNLIQYS